MYTFNWALTAFRSESYIGSATALPDTPGLFNLINTMIVSPLLFVVLLSCRAGNLRLVQTLLRQGHDVDTPDHEGRTPLMYWSVANTPPVLMVSIPITPQQNGANFSFVYSTFL